MTADILLVNPYSVEQEKRSYAELDVYPPLGILTLASTLEEKGVRARVIDATFDDFERVRKAVRDDPAPVVGVTANLITADRALTLVKDTVARGKRAIAGGPDPVLRPEAYFEAGADAVVTGEGEEALADYLGTPAESPGPASPVIPGVFFADGRPSPQRPFIRDLDRLPVPDLERVDIEAYLDFGRTHRGCSSLSIMSARGCPFQCSWCAKPVFGSTYRTRSARGFTDELEELVNRYRPDQVRILDDVFTLDRNRTAAICGEIIRRDMPVRFECLSRVDCLDRELLGLVARAGCTRIWCGIESGSQAVLDTMLKGIKVQQSRDTARLIHEAGIELACFVMLGYPGETAADIRETVSLLDEIRPDKISVSIAHPLPGTHFYEEVRDRIETPSPWKYTNEYPTAYRREYIDIYYKLARWLVYRHWRRTGGGGDASWVRRAVSFAGEQCLRSGLELSRRISRWRMPQETT